LVKEIENMITFAFKMPFKILFCPDPSQATFRKLMSFNWKSIRNVSHILSKFSFIALILNSPVGHPSASALAITARSWTRC
jgi:hypothetical protein